MRIGLLTLSAAVVLACSASTQPSEMPNWLRSVITELSNEPVASPPASIARYVYRGDTVYFLPARCCDIQSMLYDKLGTIICAPDGGITGSGDGRCPDFFSARREERLIWSDPRTG